VKELMRNAFIVLLLALAARPQTAERKPVFEAASIKPTATTDNSSSRFNTDPGRMEAQNWTFKSYILVAYELKPYQLTGITGWMDSDRYDISAKLEDMGEGELPGKDDPRARKQAEDGRIRQALQVLLADRFHLRFHRDSKMMQGYAMSLAKGGFKPSPVSGGSDPSMRYNDRHLTAKRTSMDNMASFLVNILNQPVVNRTGVEGFYDFTLDWTPDELHGRSSNTSQAPSIFTALQEQLGLRLDPRKVPVEVIAVDSAERPSEN
jgi:bla regulator protein blaR1